MLLLLLSVAVYFVDRCLVSDAISISNIEATLLADLMPPSSSECSTTGATSATEGNFSSTFDFISQGAARWDPDTFAYEEDVFLAEMIHNNSNSHRSWKMRIGMGGNPYSFSSTHFGEAMPPQLHEDGPWVDEVWQGVAALATGSPAQPPQPTLFG